MRELAKRDANLDYLGVVVEISDSVHGLSPHAFFPRSRERAHHNGLDGFAIRWALSTIRQAARHTVLVLTKFQRKGGTRSNLEHELKLACCILS